MAWVIYINQFVFAKYIYSDVRRKTDENNWSQSQWGTIVKIIEISPPTSSDDKIYSTMEWDQAHLPKNKKMEGIRDMAG